LKLHYRSPQMASTLSQTKPVHILTTCFFSTHFNMKVTTSTLFWKTLTASFRNDNLEFFSKALTWVLQNDEHLLKPVIPFNK
jgi:hypothetical protein